MRAFVLLFFSLITSLGIAQKEIPLQKAIDHIASKAGDWKLEKDDYSDLLLSSMATSDKGITYIYLNQSYKNIPVRNAMATIILDKGGNVVSDAHNLVQDLDGKINSVSPVILPENAIIQAGAHLGVSLRTKPVSMGRNENGKWMFSFPELTKADIPAELKYELVENSLKLVWNLNLDMKGSADYWDLNIDALTGTFVSKHNYTVYCQHHHGAFDKHDGCRISTFRRIQQQAKPASQWLESSSAAARYNVYAIPVESPNHGERSIVSDSDYPAASPFGWHDTDGAAGAEFTTTRGNNVHAYQDKNDDDNPDGADTNGGADLNFDFPMDLSKDPRQSADAAVTNLFYMVNMMHDVSALTGFTEEFGNFQQRNYTGKGDGDDYVLAQAFDGITLHESGQTNPSKINNANFSTPSDGFNGRMQMFFWTNEGGSVSIDAPESIKGFIPEYGSAQFGLPIPAGDEPPITGEVEVLLDNSPNPTAGCGTVINSAEITGKIALIDRGLCEFGKKVLTAQKAGAIAAIICNIAGVNGGNGEELLGMAGGASGGSVTIPSVFLKKSDCDKIRVVLQAGGSVVMTFKERERQGAAYLDGALDNGIIAHEFGHGISTRLTGGRSNSSCLNNDEQMGEGWSDFFSLIMTHEAGDKGSDVRGIGTFAAAQQTTGGGIRRYPYSTDMQINPQTFDDIKGTTAPHPLGEVWAGVLWDMYWAFIDQYGFDADWKNTNSGNYKAVFLVMEGMKMQPCNPGFIQGRDAIMKADQIHNNGIHKCMIWNVFARRGIGYFAEGGLTSDRNDGKESFEALPTCIEKLKIAKTATSSINAGDEVSVTLTCINHIPSRQNNVVITDQLPDGMSYVQGSGSISPTVSGNLLVFQIGDLEYDKELKITYKTRSSKDNKSVRLEYESFDDDFGWDIEKNEGTEDWLPTSDLFRSPETSFNIINVAAETDASLRSIPYTISGKNPAMRFWHRFNTQNGIDGGFVEISVDNGPYTPIKASQFIRNGYNGPLSYSTLAIPALDAFSGNSGGNWSGDFVGPWVDSYIDLTPYIGSEVVFRFRFGSDATVTATGELKGWYVDDFEILDIYKYTAKACIAADGGQGEKACTLPVTTLVNSELSSSTEQDITPAFTADVLPNPADEYVTILASAPAKTTADIRLLNAQGSVVYSGVMTLDRDTTYKTVNTTGLAAGFYFLTLRNGQQVFTRKVIIR